LIDQVTILSHKLTSYEKLGQSESSSLMLRLHQQIVAETEAHKYIKQQLEYTERVLDVVKINEQEQLKQISYYKSVVAEKQTDNNLLQDKVQILTKLSGQLQEEKQFLLIELSETKQSLSNYNVEQLEVEKLKEKNLQQHIDEKETDLQVSIPKYHF
jgi:GTPase involved in cell partitioning and DNA repair